MENFIISVTFIHLFFFCFFERLHADFMHHRTPITPHTTSKHRVTHTDTDMQNPSHPVAQAQFRDPGSVKWQCFPLHCHATHFSSILFKAFFTFFFICINIIIFYPVLSAYLLQTSSTCICGQRTNAPAHDAHTSNHYSAISANKKSMESES